MIATASAGGRTGGSDGTEYLDLWAYDQNAMDTADNAEPIAETFLRWHEPISLKSERKRRLHNSDLIQTIMMNKLHDYRTTRLPTLT